MPVPASLLVLHYWKNSTRWRKKPAPAPSLSPSSPGTGKTRQEGQRPMMQNFASLWAPLCSSVQQVDEDNRSQVASGRARLTRYLARARASLIRGDTQDVRRGPPAPQKVLITVQIPASRASTGLACSLLRRNRRHDLRMWMGAATPPSVATACPKASLLTAKASL